MRIADTKLDSYIEYHVIYTDLPFRPPQSPKTDSIKHDIKVKRNTLFYVIIKKDCLVIRKS